MTGIIYQVMNLQFKPLAYLILSYSTPSYSIAIDYIYSRNALSSTGTQVLTSVLLAWA